SVPIVITRPIAILATAVMSRKIRDRSAILARMINRDLRRLLRSLRAMVNRVVGSSLRGIMCPRRHLMHATVAAVEHRGSRNSATIRSRRNHAIATVLMVDHGSDRNRMLAKTLVMSRNDRVLRRPLTNLNWKTHRHRSVLMLVHVRDHHPWR